MIDRLGVAGGPLLVELLELMLSLADVLPERLALQLILDDRPLLGGEHGRVEGWSLVLGSGLGCVRQPLLRIFFS